MHTRNTYMILLILSGLAVCSNGGNSNNSSNDTNSAAESAAPEEGVFDLLVGTLDRARSVGDMGMERKAEMDRRMEELDQ